MAVRNDFTAGEVLAAADLNDTFASKKVGQIIRGTDTTERTTTSTSYVDANISVTITPTASNSVVVLVWATRTRHDGTTDFAQLQITDASNNPISGAESSLIGGDATNFSTHSTIFGYATPATTSATTYKGRFKVLSSGTARLQNDLTTGQLFAIEVYA